MIEILERSAVCCNIMLGHLMKILIQIVWHDKYNYLLTINKIMLRDCGKRQ